MSIREPSIARDSILGNAARADRSVCRWLEWLFGGRGRAQPVPAFPPLSSERKFVFSPSVVVGVGGGRVWGAPESFSGSGGANLLVHIEQGHHGDVVELVAALEERDLDNE